MLSRCSFIPLIITAKQVSPLFSVCGKRDEPLVFRFVYPLPVIALDVFFILLIYLFILLRRRQQQPLACKRQ